MLAFFCTGSSFQLFEGLDLNIQISHLRSNSGFILLSLYKSNDGFPDNAKKAYRTAKIAIKDKAAALKLSNMPAGEYAIALLHDENDDKKMNTNFFGIPKEGYGFSNNVMGIAGPPSFNKAKCTLKESTPLTIKIKMKY